MQVLTNTNSETIKITKILSSDVQCFTETPEKTGQDKQLERIDAFDLFTLFTAEIIRSRKVFTR